jgi:UDP-3-O-[3-hydroxymyristoyl] glucosamine N-acyltransferase
MKALIAILGALLVCACSTAKYEVNPDGSRPVLYPSTSVVKWQVVDGAYQSPSGDARIFIDRTVEFDKDVQLGNGVKIGAGSFIDEDVKLFPNVTVGEDTKIRGDAIVQGDVKIGNKVVIGGDSKIGAGSVIEDGATLGKWVRIGKKVSVGAGAKIGPGSVIDDGVTIASSQMLPPSSRISASK